jgi:hypothetical protein
MSRSLSRLHVHCYTVDWKYILYICILKDHNHIGTQKNLWEKCLQYCDWLIDWLIDFSLFYFPLKNISLMWRRHDYRWRAAKFRPMLGFQGLWAGRDLYRVTPAVTRGLGFFRSHPKDRLMCFKINGCSQFVGNPSMKNAGQIIELLLSNVLGDSKVKKPDKSVSMLSELSESKLDVYILTMFICDYGWWCYNKCKNR